MQRSSWDDTYLDIARTMAHRSRCVRSQVGAVIVDAHWRIIATGYNGPPAGYRHQDNVDCGTFCSRAMNGPKDPLSYADCVSIHAEANALLFCDRRHREGGVIYVSGPICWDCAKMIANSGLTRVVVEDLGDAPHRSSENGILLMEGCGLEVVTCR